MNSSFILRKYQRGDHADVRRIFYDGMVRSHWKTAYWNILSGKTVKPYFLQMTCLLGLYFSVANYHQLLLCEAILQMLWIGLLHFAFWNFTSTTLDTDMKDEDLSFWTAPDNKDFWVATYDGVIVGSVAYNVEDSILEIFRLSVDIKFRKLGIAKQLMNKIEEMAQHMGCNIVRAVTADANKAACSFYDRLGYCITDRIVAATNQENWIEVKLFPWIHGIYVVQFEKRI